MDLSTTYLGFKLPHPVIPGASPMSVDLDQVRRLEDAGAPMIVLSSLFEEQLVREQLSAHHGIDPHSGSSGEAMTYFPEPIQYRIGPEAYLKHLSRIKSSVRVPVVASLNGTTPGGWLDYAKQMQQAGADALELNLYFVATAPADGAEVVERRLASVVEQVAASLKIPVAVKLPPFLTSLPHFVQRLESAGARAAVVFNRFYEPDVNVKEQQVVRTLALSTPTELLPRLHALALLSGRVKLGLAVTGGVHSGLDALKAVMCGADAVQVVSALLMKGPEHLEAVRRGLADLLEQNEYESLAQVRGSMSLLRCPDPAAYERLNYIHILQNWRGL